MEKAAEDVFPPVYVKATSDILSGQIPVEVENRVNELKEKPRPQPGDMVDAAGDDRTVNNNLMRHAYRVLTDEEKEQMRLIKDYGQNFVDAINSIGKSRELSLAITRVEEAVMWATKAITGPK